MKSRDSFRFVVVLLCVVLAVAFTAIAFSFQVTNLQNQVNDLQAARLINVNLGYTDNGQGEINVTGYVCNPGNYSAFDCTIQIDFYRGNQIENSSNLYLDKEQGPFFEVPGGASYYVNQTITYTSAPPTNVTLTLDWWKQPWQVP